MTIDTVAKQFAAHLPLRWQQSLKQRRYRRQIAQGTFLTDEPEWQLASGWLRPGDWAIDVGANIGHYTKRFSDLVGPAGRVIAFEPVPATFELLAANAAQFATANVTLLNLAASDRTQVLSMTLPAFDTGLTNYYQAELTTEPTALQVMTCAIDSLALTGRVRLLKIDAEGHDTVVLRGARATIARDLPNIIIESVSEEVAELLGALGYVRETVPQSPNVIYRQPGQ